MSSRISNKKFKYAVVQSTCDGLLATCKRALLVTDDYEEIGRKATIRFNGVNEEATVLFATDDCAAALTFEREQAEILDAADSDGSVSQEDGSSPRLSAEEFSPSQSLHSRPPSPSEDRPPSPPTERPPSPSPVRQPSPSDVRSPSPYILSSPTSHFPTYYQSDIVDVDMITDRMQEMVRDMEKNVMDGMCDYFAYITELLQQVPAVRQHCGKTGLLLRPLPRRNTKDASIQADSVVEDGLGDCYRPPTPPTDIDHATHTPPTVENSDSSNSALICRIRNKGKTFVRCSPEARYSNL